MEGSAMQASTVAKALAVGSCAAAVLVYALYKERGPAILAKATLVVLRVVFVAVAVVLGVYLGYSWYTSIQDSKKHEKRLKDLNRVSDEVRMSRLHMQLISAQRSREAEAEAEAQRKAERERAAAAAAEARAVAATRKPGGLDAGASPEALALARARQQAEALEAQREFKRQREAAEAEERERKAAEAAERAKEAAREATQRQPGGGEVRASAESQASVRARQQESLSKTQEELRRQREAAEAEERARQAAEAAAASAQRQPGGGEVRASVESQASVRARQQESLLHTQEELRRKREAAEEEERQRRAAAAADAAAVSVQRQPGGGSVQATAAGVRRRAAGASGSSQRVWDGPVFPGDELKGWVSPASEEAARIRAQQDAELERSLRRDRSKEEARLAKERAAEEAREKKRRQEEAKQERMALLLSLVPPEPSPSDGVQRISIAVRLPDSSVRKRFWLPTNKVEDLYNWVECMEPIVMQRFQLVKPFPREVVDRALSSETTLEEGGLCPQALVVVELVS